VKTSKHAVYWAILSCMVFLCGCAAESGQAGQTSQANQINAPVDVRYIVENPLVFSEVVENDQIEGIAFIGKHFQIDGLLDKAVESKVNEHLKGMYAKYHPGEIPDVAQEKNAGLECAKQTVALECCGNYNNILSVRAIYRWMFGGLSSSPPLEYAGNYEITETYNVDLGTGEEFGLGEVFADNVDYRSLIAGSAEDYLLRFDVMVHKDILDESLAKYLKEPQFLLRGQALQTVGLRYLDPSPTDRPDIEVCVDLNLDGDFAVAKRFYDPSVNIYAGGIEGERSLITYIGEIKWLDNNYTDEGINVSLRAKYQEDFPEYALRAVFAEESEDGDLINRMKEVLKSLSAQETDTVYNKFVDTSRVQDFINIRIYEDASVYSLSTDVQRFYSSRQTLWCYRLGSEEPVQIADIFHESADIDGILEAVVANKLEADQQLREESGLSRSIDVAAHAEGAAGKIVGFCVNYNAIFAEYLGDPALPSYVIELKYADLGYENLNIFDWYFITEEAQNE